MPCSSQLFMTKKNQIKWKQKGNIVVIIDLVTVFDAILTRRQKREKLQCLYENLVSNNFRRITVLKKKKMNCKLKLHSQGFY